MSVTMSKNGEHKGKIVEKIVRSRGYKLTLLASRLRMSRSTLYKQFKMRNLSDSFLFKLGKVLEVDFRSVFPELRYSVLYEPVDVDPLTHEAMLQMNDLRFRYMLLLEDYNKLLQFFVSAINEKEFHSVKVKVSRFVEIYMKKQ